MPKSQPVSLTEAARALHVSRRTVQRMLSDGTLRGEKHGGQWAITLPIDVQQTGTDRTDAQRAQDDVLAQLRAEHAQALAQVTSQLAVTQAKLEAVQGERDRLLDQLAEASRRLDDATQQVSSLTATLFQMTSQRLLPAPGKRRAWWRFWERDEETAEER